MEESDATLVLTELIERTETFIASLSGDPQHAGSTNTEALAQFIAERQTLLDPIVAQPIADPEAVELGQHLLKLDAELNALLNGERELLQTEMGRLRQGRRGLKGYRHRPIRGRSTLDIEG